MTEKKKKKDGAEPLNLDALNPKWENDEDCPFKGMTFREVYNKGLQECVNAVMKVPDPPPLMEPPDDGLLTQAITSSTMMAVMLNVKLSLWMSFADNARSKLSEDAKFTEEQVKIFNGLTYFVEAMIAMENVDTWVDDTLSSIISDKARQN